MEQRCHIMHCDWNSDVWRSTWHTSFQKNWLATLLKYTFLGQQRGLDLQPLQLLTVTMWVGWCLGNFPENSKGFLTRESPVIFTLE